ncbi:MAG TPA: ABC transporter substrate-binding protein [Firmicutes bacterium]|nr:ABC transporter substrate-binding protein [Bacillota bacterium]HHY97718.1 ABC transporter substrate-binding protein [Bacillota bacterium]
MSMRKQSIAVGLILILTLLCFAGSAMAKKVTITYWTGWGGSELEDLKKIIDEFNKSNPRVQVETTTIFGAYEKLLTAIAGGRAPDVVSAVWASQLAALAHNGGIMPLDKYVSKSDKVKAGDFFPSLWKSFHYNGKLYGLAATTNTNFVAYNKAMFKEVGLDPAKPPEMLNELEAYAKKLTKWDTQKNITRLGYLPAGIWKWALVFGGDWYDEDKKQITADNPKNVEALKWLGKYWAEYGVDSLQKFTAGFGNYWSPNNPFMVGKLAMQDYGEWLQQFGEKYNPKLEYGLFATPYPAGGRKNVTTFGGSIFCIPVGSKHPDEAWEFIEWITGPYAQKKIAKVFTNMPPRVAVAKDPELLADVPILKFGLKLLEGPNAFGDIQIPVWAQYQEEMGRVEEQVTRGQMTAEAALKELQAKMQKELEKTLRK